VSRPATDAVTAAGLVLGLCLAGCSIVRDPETHPFETQRDRSPSLAEFLYAGQPVPGRYGAVRFQPPIRIGITFLPQRADSDAVPTSGQRETTLMQVREVMAALPYVSEVIVVPEYWLGNQPAEGFEKLRALARRFDFDLIAVIASDQTASDMRNFRSLGWITYFGDKLWLGDVDQARTVVELAVVEPDSRALVLRATSALTFGDSTSVLDDWRSSDFVRHRGFDEARNLLIDDLRQQLADLHPRVDARSR